MRLHRFYISQPLGEVVVIRDSSVLKQWKNVFRYTTGSSVVVFNGDGYEYVSTIESITTHECTVRQISKSLSYIPSKKVTLYLSLIKKDNFEFVVQKATELGITAIVPIISERSEKKNLNDERLQKIAIEASEQCGRGDIPKISPIVKLTDVFQTINTDTPSIILNMDGISVSSAEMQGILGKGNDVNLFIGPEGGWSESEVNNFREKAFVTISLGKTVLRAETAAITACAFTCI